MASSKDLERQAELDRSRIAATLDELRGRMTPGQLADQALAYARGHGGAEFVRNLGEQAKANPLPVALAALSLGWLMVGGRTSPRNSAPAHAPSIVPDDGPYAEGFGDRARDASAHAAGALRDSASATADHARGAIESAREGASDAMGRARSGLSSARESASDAAERARETMSSAYGAAAGAVGRTAAAASDAASALGRRAHDLRDYASDFGRGAAERARHAGQSVAEQAGRAQNAVTQIVREQPLIVAAVGLALGAIIGAALPRTRREDELMGETSDELKETAMGAAREQFAQVQEAGGRIVEKVQSEAQSQGLSPDSAKELIEDIGGRVAAVAAAARVGAEDELKAAKEQAEAQGEDYDHAPAQEPEKREPKGQVEEGAGPARYSEADPNYLPEGSGQPAGQDIKTAERVG